MNPQIFHRTWRVLLFSIVVQWPLSAQINITGYVRDASNQKPISDAEVYFYDPTGKRLPIRSTNSDGFFRFETNFKPGQFVTIKVGKTGEYTLSESVSHLISDPAVRKNEVNFYLRKDEATSGSLKITGHVYNQKNKKPVSGANVSVPDLIGKWYSVKTDATGLYDLNTFVKPGNDLNFRVEMPGYHPYPEAKTLKSEGNQFDFYIRPTAKFPCECLLYGSGAAALTSGGTYWGAGSKYNSSKDFSNNSRQRDYNSANTLNRVSIASAGTAVGLFGGWLLCKHLQKKKAKATLKGRRPGHSSIAPLRIQDNSAPIGIAYRF